MPSPARAESELSARSPTQPLPSLPPPPAIVQEQPPGAEDLLLTEPQRPAQLGRVPATDHLTTPRLRGAEQGSCSLHPQILPQASLECQR